MPHTPASAALLRSQRNSTRPTQPARIKRSANATATRVLPVPVASTHRAFRRPSCRCSAVRWMASIWYSRLTISGLMGSARQGLALAFGEALRQAVAGVEAEEAARCGLVGLVPAERDDVVPHGDLPTVGVEDQRALAILPLEGQGVRPRLHPARLHVFGGLFGLDHGERFAIVTPEHVVGVADAATLFGLLGEQHLLADFVRALAVFADLPTRVLEEPVNQVAARLALAQREGLCGLVALGFQARELGRGGGREAARPRSPSCDWPPISAKSASRCAPWCCDLLFEGGAGFSGLGVRQRRGGDRRWRRREGRELLAFSPRDGDVEPARDVECLAQELERHVRGEPLAVGGLVSADAQEVELVDDDARDRLEKRRLLEAVVEIGAEGTWQPAPEVDGPRPRAPRRCAASRGQRTDRCERSPLPRWPRPRWGGRPAAESRSFAASWRWAPQALPRARMSHSAGHRSSIGDEPCNAVERSRQRLGDF